MTAADRFTRTRLGLRRTLGRIPVHARIGLAAAAVILVAFVALLLATQSDRAALRREVVSAFATRLKRAGIALRSPLGRSVVCQPELTYHLICDASLAAADGTARFDLRYVDSGCWHAGLLSAPAATPSLPAKFSGCV
jgi:hypothetical protein